MTLGANAFYEKKPVAAATANIKALPGRVFAVYANNMNATVRYLQLFDSTGATTTIKREYTIPAGSHIGIDAGMLPVGGLKFSTGITFGISTTAGSYVAATPSEHDLNLDYR